MNLNAIQHRLGALERNARLLERSAARKARTPVRIRVDPALAALLADVPADSGVVIIAAPEEPATSTEGDENDA